MDFRPTTIESNQRGWADAFAIMLILLSLLFFPITWPIYQVRRYYQLRTRGFWVTRQGRDAIEYQELQNGKVERLTIDGELMAVGPHVVYLPTEAEWQQSMPQWARGRRAEIIENVKRALGTRNYEYDLPVSEGRREP